MLGVEAARLQSDLIAEIDRKGSTRESIAVFYRSAIICGPESIDWPCVNGKLLERYKPSGLAHIKALAWGTKRKQASK